MNKTLKENSQLTQEIVKNKAKNGSFFKFLIGFFYFKFHRERKIHMYKFAQNPGMMCVISRLLFCASSTAPTFDKTVENNWKLILNI